jgi:hypothetical protein
LLDSFEKKNIKGNKIKNKKKFRVASFSFPTLSQQPNGGIKAENREENGCKKPMIWKAVNHTKLKSHYQT